MFNFICPRIAFQNRINNKYFSRPGFSVTFTKNILILSNSDSIINFKLRRKIFLSLVILTLTLTLNLGALGFIFIFSVKAE